MEQKKCVFVGEFSHTNFKKKNPEWNEMFCGFSDKMTVFIHKDEVQAMYNIEEVK